MTLTQSEQEELRVAIAEEMGLFWKTENGATCAHCGFYLLQHYDQRTCLHIDYTTSIDAIREAAMERFKSSPEVHRFGQSLLQQFSEGDFWGQWQLTALDWCIAFARTAKIWRRNV